MSMTCATPDPSVNPFARPRPIRRRLRRVACLALLLGVSGCRFLADEFIALDRAGPVVAVPMVSGADAPR